MILNDAIDKYKKYIIVTRSEGTVNYFEGKIGIIKKYLGYLECDKINNDLLLDFLAQQKERNPDISNRTLNKYIGTIRQVLKYTCNIDIDTAKLREVKKVIKTIPLEDVNKVFNYYRKNQTNYILQRNYIMFRLFFETGLRLSELLNLKISNINFERNTIHVQRTKTSVERYVFYTNETKELLNQYILTTKLDYLLFIDFNTGDRLNTQSVDTICIRLRKKLMLKENINAHKWRHTFASNFVKKNGNMEVLRQIMGHTSLKTTQKYLHVNVDDLHKEYFRLYK